MLSNILRDRVQIQIKDTIQGPLGETVVWTPVEKRYARVIPLDVKTVASYQQLNTVVTHKILLRGSVTIELGNYRLLHGSKTYEPASSAKHFEGVTEIIVKET